MFSMHKFYHFISMHKKSSEKLSPKDFHGMQIGFFFSNGIIHKVHFTYLDVSRHECMDMEMLYR